MFSDMWSKKRWKISDDEQGLRILTKINGNSYGNSSLVIVKPYNILQLPTSCYLKSCHLCHNPLPLHKEIYMYRGDLGFCSVQCRDRQIYLDEIKEMELTSIFSSCSCKHDSKLDFGRHPKNPLNVHFLIL